jgi:hypothetical protein
MLEILSRLTNWEGTFIAKESKKEVSKQDDGSFGENLPPIDEEKLQKTMRMMGKLSNSLEKQQIQKYEARAPTDPLSDDYPAAYRKEVVALRREKDQLLDRCNNLEQTVNETRRESDLWKLKMTMAMGNMRTKVESLEEDKQCLEDKCQELAAKSLNLRMKNASKQSLINALECRIKADNEKDTRVVASERSIVQNSGERKQIELVEKTEPTSQSTRKRSQNAACSSIQNVLRSKY